MNSAEGKGSTRRPQQITDAEMERRWKLAFQKKRKRDPWKDAQKERPDLWEIETLEDTKRDG